MTELYHFSAAKLTAVPPDMRNVAALALDLVREDLQFNLPLRIEWLDQNSQGRLRSSFPNGLSTANCVGLRADLSANQIVEEVARQVRYIQLVGGGTERRAANDEATNYSLRWQYRGAALSLKGSTMFGRSN